MKLSINRHVTNKSRDWESLATQFQNVDLSQVELAAEINAGHAFSTQHQGRRQQENFLASGYVALDFDRANMADVETIMADPLVSRYHAIFYWTASSTPETPKFRIIFELAQAIFDADYYRKVVAAFLWKFSANIDKSCADPCRLFYGSKDSNPTFTGETLPMAAVADIVKEHRQHLEQERRAKEQADLERRKAATQVGANTDKGKKAFISKVLDTHCEKIRLAPHGERHDTLIRSTAVMGGYLAGEALATDEYEIRRRLEEAYSTHQGFNRSEMLSTIEYGLEKGRAKPLYVEPLPANPVIDFKSFTGAKVDPWQNESGEKQEEAGEKPKPKRLWHVDDLAQFPKPAWLVQDELQRNSLAFLIGESGSGKSFVALHYSLQVAQAENVVYIAGEGASGYKQRIDAWREYYRPDACQMYLWPSPLALVDPISRAEFLKEIEELKPSLIVIDTLARSAVGLDENSARDMGMLVAACDEVKIATGACVLVVHHTGKNGASERGSSALRGAADTMLKVVEDAELRKIVFDKQKDAPEKEPRYIKLAPVGESLVVMEANKNEAITGNTVKGKVKEVLEAMAGEIFKDTGATWKRLIEVLNWESSSGRKAEMFKILNHLKKSGYIRQADRGEPYYITPAGLDVVAPQDI
jgi:ABC-type oligopeptide transport system ATPase subunit